MSVAHELGYTLSRLWAEVTQEELMLWSLFFSYRNDEQEKAMKKARQGR